MKAVKNVNPAIYGDLQRVERAIKKEHEETGKNLNIYILIKGEKRSLNQNRYMWGVVCKILSESTGHQPDEMHEYCIDKFAPVKFVKVFGKIIECKKRTSEMSTKEFNEYIDKIRLFSDEQGFGYIPLPNEVPEELYTEIINQ